MPRKIPIGILKNHRKHIVQNSLFVAASGGKAGINLVDAVNVADITSTNPILVREGCTIKAVYLEYWCTGDDVVQSTQVSLVEKLPNNTSPVSAADMADLDEYENKNNILEMHMGLNNPEDGVAQPLFRGWITIPKGKQRFALGEKLSISFLGQSDGLQMCGFAIYKEYY